MPDEFLNIQVLDWKMQKKVKICIITIIKEEMQEIIKLFNMKIRGMQYTYWEGGISGNPNIIIHCYQQNESGNVYSTQLMQYLLSEDYDYYFCIGTAGAVQANLYDVIIANQIVYLEKGANTLLGKEYDGKAIEITEREKNIINTFLSWLTVTKKFNFKIEAAPIYSGENVEKNPDAIDLLQGKAFARHLAAIDMESFGVLQALQFFKSFHEGKEKYITVIRGISDKADDLKNAVYDDGLSADERKEQAMKNVLDILVLFILFITKPQDCI